MANLPMQAPPRGNKTCPNDCNGVGNCHAEYGYCQCPAGDSSRNLLDLAVLALHALAYGLAVQATTSIRSSGVVKPVDLSSHIRRWTSRW